MTISPSLPCICIKLKHCSIAIKSILYFVCVRYFILARMETGGDVRSLPTRCLSIPIHSSLAWFWNILAFLYTFTTALKMAIIDCENQSLLHTQYALFSKHTANTFVFLCMLAEIADMLLIPLKTNLSLIGNHSDK